jgi:hypothetical protein
MKVLSVVAYAILLFITQAKGDGETITKTSSGKVVVVLGDETATGVAERLSELFAKSQIATRVNIVNAGVKGDITMFSMARLDSHVLSISPDIVILSVGRHDLLQGRYVLESEIDLAIIKAKAQDIGAKVIVITPNEFDEGLTPESYARVVTRVYGETSKLLRGKPDCPIPTITFVTDPRKSMQKVTISWVAQEGVVYELITPYQHGSEIGWNVVATIKGTIVDARLTLPASEHVEIFRLRATWEK